MTKSISNIFLTKLCVTPHTCKIQNISDRIFIWPPGSSHMGLTWEYRGGVRGVTIFFRNLTRFGVRVTYMNGTCTGAIFVSSPPWGLWEGPKGQVSLNLNYKVNFSKIFKPNFAYFLTNERYITYQMGFLLSRLGHAQGWDLGVTWEV